jgi:hypothetical protein
MVNETGEVVTAKSGQNCQKCVHCVGEDDCEFRGDACIGSKPVVGMKGWPKEVIDHRHSLNSHCRLRDAMR